jgi:hypothetical protein
MQMLNITKNKKKMKQWQKKEQQRREQKGLSLLIF